MKTRYLTLFIALFSISVFAQDVNMQNGTITQCSGNLFDSGGPSANYGNDENFILTICSPTPGEVIQLNFLSFSTQINLDILTIYDGDSTAAPIIGNFSGGGASANPNFITASTSNPTGCLTLEFISDGSANTTGFEAEISCFEPCQTITAVLDSTSPAYDTTENTVEADVNETITFNGSGVFSNSGAGATYVWDFGNGDTLTGQSVDYAYPTAGIYTVTLTITDTNPNGCSSSNDIGLEAIIGASTPGNPYVDAGDDVVVDCVTGCVDLSATFLDIGETNTYTFSQIPFVPPFPFNGLSNSINTNIDDAWSPVENLPFDFCFFDNTETQFQVGSNGVIRFDVNAGDVGGGSNGYSLGAGDDLPNNTNPTLGEANVLTPCHDIDPSVNNSNEIRWEIIGTAPNRVLAVSYYQVPMYSTSCNNLLATHMAVFYETTNVIDIYIEEKPACTTFNGGRAALGIQNDAGTTAFVPPGRNISDSPWTTSEEAWRFVPAGPSVVTFEWLDSTGAVVSTDPNFTVCPTADTFYTARVTYNNCNGDIIVVTDDVNVYVPLGVDLGPDQSLCVGDPDIVLDASTSSTTATYQWQLDGVDITGETSSMLTVSSPNSGTYTVIVDDQGCQISDDVDVTFSDGDSSFTVAPTCDGATVSNVVTPGGIFNLVTTGATIDSVTGEVTGALSGSTHTIEYTTPGACSTTTSETFTVLTTDDSSFTMTPTCDGAIVDSEVTPGTYMFNPDLGDGSIIDSNTGTITNGVSGTTYTVDHTTNGVCPATSTINVTVYPFEDPSFTVTPTCDGATVVVTGDLGGTFLLNPDPGAPVSIDSSTGEVTGGDSETSYTIEYITNGPCPEISSQTFTVLTQDDSSFTASPTCDGAVMSNVLTPGGTFALTTTGATIDPVTGTVTGAASGSTHTVTYTTTGICPTTTSVDFTVLITDDASFTMQPTCDGAVVDSEATPGTYAFNPLPGDGATIDSATGTIMNGTQGSTYTVEHTTNGVCPASTTVDVTVYPLEDPSFTVTATCDGATVTITGDAGGTFALNPDPGAPVTIDASTGEVTGGDYGVTFTIEYTTPGPCPEVSTQNVTTLTEDDPSFTMIPNCDGGTVDTVAMPGGTYTFNPPAPAGDTVQINPTTGEVTTATPGTSYTVEYTTATQCPATSTFVLNVLPADNSSFVLDPTCDGATATVTGLSGGTFALTTTGATIDPVTGTVTGALPSSVHTVEYTTNGPCPTTTTQNVVVHPEVIAIDPTPLEVCDDNVPDGITQIDLTLKDTEVTGGIATYIASYYLTFTDADTATNPLPIPYTNLVNGQIIHVRVEDANTGCYDTTTLELQVEQAPTAFTPTPLEFCDPDSDGFGEFMLTDVDTQVTGGAAGLVVTYHETMSDAENNVNALSSPYDNIVFETQTIYVRVESQTIATDCASYVELQLIVNDTPQIELTPAELEECDDDTDGLAAFDLTQANDELLNLLDSDTSNDIDPSEVTITYYQSEADAEAPSNAIGTPSNYTNVTPDMETIWVRVEYDATGCYTVTDLDLIVNPLPVLVQPDPLNLCDYNNPGDEQEAFILEDANAQILNGQTGITLTYYSTQAGANTADGSVQIFSPYTNGPNPQTVYVRAEDNVTGCVNTVTLDLRVNPLPSPVAPSPIVACDDDNDGFYTEFDLDSQTTTIINGEPNISISYYETLTNAQNGTDPIVNTSSYENIDPDNQTIYVRAENNITGCYTIVTMDLIVEPSPVIPTDLADYIICDDNDDGFNQFDFNTVMTPQILGSQDPADFVLTYHVTQAQAETGANPIVNTGNYTNQSNPQTIYIRLVSNINGCVSLGEFEIRVEFPPVIIQPTALSICDELDANYYENNDQFAVFDLTVKNDEITGGVGSWTVTYYETLADAQSDTNAIPDPTMYQNTDPAVQTVHVRVTDNDTGCFSLTTLTIRVLNNPSPTENPTDLELCDDVNIVGPNDMIEEFDLTTYEVAIINGELDVTASYYTDLDDALAGSNAIADPTMHTNEDPDNPGTSINPQTIYVRVTNGDDETGLNGTGCFTLVDFDITVNPLPVVSPIEDYIICELNTDEVAGFDLESKTDEILNGQDPTVFTVTYHDTQADADSGINALVSPYNNTSNPQVIYVNITNTITGCDVTTMFNIEVNEAAQANQAMPVYYECDDNIEFDGNPSNDSVQFDLSSQDAAVLMGQDPANYITSYYETLADAEAATNALPLLYENTSNPQVIYVRVDNDTMVDDGTGNMVDSSVCYEIATITLQVNPLPVVDLDASYLLCVDTNGTEVLNPLVIDTGLSASDYTFEWTLGGAVVGTGSSIMPTQGGTYTVTIEDNLTGCTSTDTTLVEESAPPSIVADVITPAFAEVHSIQVTATGTGISTYEFQLDGGPWYNNEPNDNTYIFNDVSGGEHTITVRDINGCGESSTTVMVMDYPHFFTPNGDTYNETWQIYGISDQPDAVIYIFDRYGKLLKQLNPTGPGWDGNYNGNPLPTSDYWFTVEYREPGDTSDVKKQFRAHFTLKR